MSSRSLSDSALVFKTFLHGTVFGDRPLAVSQLTVGERLILVPDPAGTAPPAVWAHASGGDVLGHVPEQVAAWMAPWMLEGGRAAARVLWIGDATVESWKRVEIEVDIR
jgi:hypothetical protein